MNRQSVISSCVFIVASLALPDSLLANAPQRMSVLGLEPIDVAVKVSQSLALRLEQRLRSVRNIALVASKNIDEVKLVFGCVDEQPMCMARVARSIDVDALMWGSVRLAESGFRLTLKAYRSKTKSISKVTIKVAAEDDWPAIDAALIELTEKMAVAKWGDLTVTSPVVGATVSVDGVAVGVIDHSGRFVMRLPWGSYRLSVRAERFVTMEKSISITKARTETVSAELVSASSSSPGVDLSDAYTTATDASSSAATPSAASFRQTGWAWAFYASVAATIGVGIGLVATGVSVKNLETDKEQVLRTVLAAHANGANVLSSAELAAFGNGGDACSLSGRFSELDQICSRGKSRAVVTNVLVGATVVSAVATVFFGYKAYVSRVSPEVSPQSASLVYRVQF